MARTKTLGANLPVPQSRDEAAATIRAIGELNRQVARLEADMNDELAKVKERFEGALDALRRTLWTPGEKQARADLATTIDAYLNTTTEPKRIATHGQD